MVRGVDAAGRSGGQVADAVAGGETVVGIERANREGAIDTAAHIRLDLGAGRSGGGSTLGFQGPFLLRAVNLAEVVDAGVLLRRRAGMHEVRNRDGGQQTDDGDDDHDFDKGETRFACGGDFHTIALLFSACGVNFATGGLIYFTITTGRSQIAHC